MKIKKTEVSAAKWRKLGGVSGGVKSFYRRLITPVVHSEDWGECTACGASPKQFISKKRGLYQFCLEETPSSGKEERELIKNLQPGNEMFCNARCFAKHKKTSRTQIAYSAAHAAIGSYKKEQKRTRRERDKSLRNRFRKLGRLHGASTVMAGEDNISRQAMSIALRRAFGGKLPYREAGSIPKKKGEQDKK